MPFITNETGTVIWREPSSEDIVTNRKELTEIEDTSIQRELNKDLQDKIAEHARYLISSNKGVIPFTNRNIYQTIRNIIQTTPGKVDIIVPVYNSIHIAKQCLEKVVERTVWPYHLYIVDDASDEYTHNKLEEFVNNHPDIATLITNQRNRGFAATVNRGVRAGNGEYVCLLNSDVLVTDMWLTKLVLSLKADDKNQIACPATNNTAVVDIPMAQGSSYLAMNSVFERFAVRNYPEIMPTGFCFILRRELLNKIGYLDESYANFGEETEAWWRTITYSKDGHFPNYRAVMADDSYVFHQRGESFSSLGASKHMGLRKTASALFNSRHPEFAAWQKNYNVKKSLGHLRDRIPTAIINDRKVKYRVCWVVHATDRCGGMQYIADIVNELNERGVDAKVVLIKRKPESPTDYISDLRSAPVVFDDYSDFLNNFSLRVFRKGIVIASTVELSSVVRALSDNFPEITPVFHCQSYEPDLIQDPSLVSKIKQYFHLIPNVITNSHWITEKFEQEFNISPIATVHPGVDVDLFYPRDRSLGDERPTVMIPVSTLPYRGYDRVVEIINELEKEKSDLRILLVGVNKSPVPTSRAIALGPLAPVRLATLLGTEVDLFVEPSYNHSYGMPALEAMASGVPVVSWDNKGIFEYANNNCVILGNSEPIEASIKHILEVLKNTEIRREFSSKALAIRETHNRNNLVAEFIEALEKKFNLNYAKRKITMVVPHLRKHGGPTTMLHIANELSNHGHDVQISTLHDDINHEVTRMTHVPINTIDPITQDIPKCDIAIINSDHPLCAKVANAPQIKKKVLLKLSQNARFKQLEEKSLQQKWDAIVTSSDWLKAVCENVQDGWNYFPHPATRIGWWHYGHEQMSKAPCDRVYNDGVTTPLVIGTLIHHHPSKGSQDAIQVLGEIQKSFGNRVRFIGVGEIDPRQFQLSLTNFAYKYSPNREEMAETLQMCDIWFGASHTEGLGRMALEAMSASCAVVCSNTNPEFADPGVNCLLYPVGDIKAGIENVTKVLNDAELRKNLQDQGYQTAKKFSNSIPCVDALEEVIRKVF